MKKTDSIPFFTDKWKDIEDLTQRWIRRCPNAYRLNMQWVQEARIEYKQEKYQTRDFRKGIVIHPSLLTYIQQFHPTFLDTKDDLRNFSTKFPAFNIDSGVAFPKKLS